MVIESAVKIEKKPTENLLAYDYYLQALDPFFTRTNESLEKAIGLFEKAYIALYCAINFLNQFNNH